MARKPVAREVKKVERPKREVTKKQEAAVAKKKADEKKKVAKPAKKVEKKVVKKKVAAKKGIRKSHPPYSSMIKRALKSNSPSATSLQFISKFIESNFTVPESYKRYLRQALKRMEEKEKTIFKVRASFKLSAKGKGTSRSRSASPKRKASASPRAKKEKT